MRNLLLPAGVACAGMCMHKVGFSTCLGAVYFLGALGIAGKEAEQVEARLFLSAIARSAIAASTRAVLVGAKQAAADTASAVEASVRQSAWLASRGSWLEDVDAALAAFDETADQGIHLDTALGFRRLHRDLVQLLNVLDNGV